MRFLIYSDLFSLESWLIEGKSPEIMPAVYEFFDYLGNSENHSFVAIIFHPSIRKQIHFPNGSAIEIYPLHIPFHYVRKFMSVFWMWRVSNKWLSKEDFDVHYGMSIYSIIARFSGKKKDVLSVSRIFGSLIYYEYQQKKFWKIYTRYFLQLLEIKMPTKLIICTEDGTEFDRALEIFNPGKSAHLLVNGINSTLRKKLLSIPPVTRLPTKGTIKMISVGRFTHWKRHDLAIELLYHLKKSHHLQRIELTILGKGDTKGKLIKKAKALGVFEEVHFKDPVPHSAITKVLADHPIYLSLYDASNLSNSMWEASLAGRLICARPSGKTGRYFKHMENCILHDSIQEMANSLVEILNSEYLSMPLNARKVVNDLIPSWKERFSVEMKIIEGARRQKSLTADR